MIFNFGQDKIHQNFKNIHSIFECEQIANWELLYVAELYLFMDVHRPTHFTMAYDQYDL